MGRWNEGGFPAAGGQRTLPDRIQPLHREGRLQWHAVDLDPDPLGPAHGIDQITQPRLLPAGGPRAKGDAALEVRLDDGGGDQRDAARGRAVHFQLCPRPEQLRLGQLGDGDGIDPQRCRAVVPRDGDQQQRVLLVDCVVVAAGGELAGLGGVGGDGGGPGAFVEALGCGGRKRQRERGEQRQDGRCAGCLRRRA